MNLKEEIVFNTEKFSQIINIFEDSRKNICEIFEQEKANVELINKTSIWSGPTQEKIYDKYQQFQKNFSPIEDALKVYIDFLKKTLDDYNKLEDTLNKNLEELTEELDVN